MKIPFVQHIGIGIHITQQAIRWVELSRLGKTMKIQNTDCEEVQSGDIEQSLSTLIERRNPSFPYVTINIDSSYVRQQLFDVPRFDDPEFFSHWLDEQKKKLIPKGINPQEFISTYHLLGDGEEQKCLFVIAKKEAVESRKELLESVGLKASIVTIGQLQSGYGLVFDEDFVSREVRLISIFEDGASLQYYGNGFLENYMSLSHVGTSVTNIVEEAKTYLITDGADFESLQNQSIYLVKSNFIDAEEKAVNSVLSVDKVQQGQPLSNISSDEVLSADYSIAAGMAVKQLYPALDTINLQDEEKLDAIEKEVQKKDTLHTGIALGGLVVFTFFILLIAQFFLDTRLEKVGKEAILLQDDINTVRGAAKRVEQLKKQAGQATQLVAERTSVAKTIRLLGKSLPDRVWYNEISINKSENGKNAVIYGYAHNDALIASLMERLEKKESIGNVRLIYSEAVNSADVYNDASFNSIPLVQFEVRISMKSEEG